MRPTPVLWCLVLAARVAAADDELSAYVAQIRPLLAERCCSCHGGLRQEAGLRLDTVALLLAGSESGPVVAQGDPDASLLVARVGDPDPESRMPPEGEGEPLSRGQIEVVRAWIAAGCPAPNPEHPEVAPRDHWAFQPLTPPDVPRVTTTSGACNPIDAFLESARRQVDVTAQPEAPRHVLVRRLYLDLIGLPPQPEDLAAIETDAAADWYERLVERLLADPRHGERWARHWMDVWRYSEWWGLGPDHRNSARHMWRFRDWIIESLNADVGYDEMVRQMLAADELYPDDPAKLRATGFLARNYFKWNRTQWLDETVEHVGKGMLGLTVNCSKCHAHKYDPIQQADYYRLRAFFEPLHVRYDAVPGQPDPEIDGLARVFDGQLDSPTYLFIRGDEKKPDTSRSMEPGVPEVLAFHELVIEPVGLPRTAFEPERRPGLLDAHLAAAGRAVVEAEARQDAEPSPAHEQELLVAEAEHAAVRQRVDATRAAWAAADSPSDTADDPLATAAAAAARAAARAERDAAVARAWATVAGVSEKLARAVGSRNAAAVPALEKELAAARAALDKASEAAAIAGGTFTPLRGAKWLATRFASSAEDDPVVAFPPTSSGRRRALAAWIVDPRNPLPARVAVNHVWMRHLGKPLVATVFDFGRKGNAPTHPQLLDWLASEFIANGWSLKHLHRVIVTSAAYRMGSSTAGAEAALRTDPDNRLLWRREPIRLEAQVVRDAILALAGTLDATLGGPSVPEAEQADSNRRSLYFWHSDISRNAFLATFDDASVAECYQRDQSIVPQQALALSNAAVVLDAAARITERLGGGAGTDADFLDRLFALLLQRAATPAERAACIDALAKWRALGEPADGVDPARTRVAWALFNHTDFVTLR